MNVIVVGAGIVGCAVGYELAARGARVRIVDMRGVGQGATRASAGVLCPHIEGHSDELRRLGIRSLSMYDSFIERVTADAAASIEYRRTGTLEVALTETEADGLRRSADAHARAGIEHRYLGGRDALALEPALARDVVAALFVPVHGYVGVTGFTEALAAAAKNRGAEIERGVVVRRVTHAGDGVRVETDSAVLEADTAIIAAGSWSDNITDAPSGAVVKPIRGQLLHLALPAPPVSQVIWGSQCYLVPWRDGTILVGATVEDVGFDENATVAGVGDLLEHACELLPRLRTAAFNGVRVGLRPATADELPIVGRSSTQAAIVYATGHYRNGVLLAPFTAAAVADLVLGGQTAPELTLTDPARFGL